MRTDRHDEAFRSFANAPKIYIDLHGKYPLYSCPVLMKLEFSRQIFENIEIKVRPVGADLFHAEGQTDRWTDRQTWAKLIVAFHIH